MRCERSDFDCDDDVDLGNYLSFASRLTGPGSGPANGCHQADLDGDNDVDVADLVAFQAAPTGSKGRFPWALHPSQYHEFQAASLASRKKEDPPKRVLRLPSIGQGMARVPFFPPLPTHRVLVAIPEFP